MKRHLLLFVLLFVAALTHAFSQDSHLLTIYYVKVYAEDTINTYTETFPEGATFSVTSPIVPGHYPDPEIVTGTMPNHDTVCNVEYLRNEYSVTVSASAGGTASFTEQDHYYYQDIITFDATPDGSHKFDRWTDANEAFLSDTNPFEVTIIQDTALKAWFVLKASPQITIDSMTNITQNAAKVIGTLTNEDGVEIQNCGICWSTTLDPTMDDSHSSIEATPGTFSVELEDLEPNTTYYVRGYIETNEGMFYGGQKFFTTSSVPVFIIYVSECQGGTIQVSSTTAAAGESITVTIQPDSNHLLLSEHLHVNSNDEPSLTIEVTETGENAYVFTMPAFDVSISAQFSLKAPQINEITPPVPVCSGQPLELSTPDVSAIVDTSFWQISADDSFINPMTYDGQPLDGSYNGWYLRFVATNSAGTDFSNAVTITIYELKVFLTGETDVCTHSTEKYYVRGIENATYLWKIITPADTIEMAAGQDILVQWPVTSGHGQVSVTVTAPFGECSETQTLDILVSSRTTDLIALVPSTMESEKVWLLALADTTDYQYQWYRNDTLLENENRQYIHNAGEPLKDGVYKVYYSLAQDQYGHLICGSFSKEYEVKNGSNSSDIIHIFPNPSSPDDIITILYENEGHALVDIYTIDGRLVYSRHLKGGLNGMTFNLTQGIYVARITNGADVLKIEKIIVK